MFKFMKYMSIAMKFAELQEDAEGAKVFIKDTLKSLEGVDKTKDKLALVLKSLGSEEDEITEIIEKVFEVVKIVADVDLTDTELEDIIEKVFLYGSYIYKVTQGNIDSATALTYIATLLEDIEAKKA